VDGSVNGAKPAPQRDAAKSGSLDNGQEFAVLPAESAEDEFFAQGEVNSSFPPAAMDVAAQEFDDDLPESKPLTPAQIERRARLRRIVGSIVGAAAVMTAVVGAKALSAPPAKVTASQGSLNVPHQVVPSIGLAAQDEPASAKTAAAEKVTAPDPGAAAAVDTAPVGENAAAHEGTGESDTEGDPGSAAATRRLPVIDVEIPASTDPVTDKQWESAAKNLASQDFKGADSAFAELSKRGDLATREAARLARAIWWRANGRQNEVKPVIADLAANAATPSVRAHARDVLRTN